MNPHRKPHIRLTDLPDSVESPDRTPFTLRYAPHFTRGNRSAAKISICFRTAKPERGAMGPIHGKDTRQGTVFRLPRHATGYSHGSRERLLIFHRHRVGRRNASGQTAARLDRRRAVCPLQKGFTEIFRETRVETACRKAGAKDRSPGGCNRAAATGRQLQPDGGCNRAATATGRRLQPGGRGKGRG